MSYTSEFLTDEFLQGYKDRHPNWGFNGLGYLVYKRTYARDVAGENRKEDWWETIARAVNGGLEIGAGWTQEEARTIYDHWWNLRALPAGRMLWQLGTDTVKRFGGSSMLNCWYTSITKPEDFCFLFEMLMLGGGVGFSVKKEHIHELPKVKKGVNVVCQNDKGVSDILAHCATLRDHSSFRSDVKSSAVYKEIETIFREGSSADLIVSDSREGWTKLLRDVLNSYFKTGKGFTYSTILVRGRGEKINGFGGTASGPAILVEGIGKITKVLKGREGKKLRSVDVLDICNIIGSIVVAGNVRRSAEIAIGDPDDFLFLRAKRWELGNIPNTRDNSNNTIGADSFEQISEDFWAGYNGGGEPYGLFNLPLSLSTGRLGDGKPDECEGMNPCGEIVLADKECCNLSELFLNNIETEEQLRECISGNYKLQKAICAMSFLHKETDDIVHKHMRIGMGVTGICQSLDKLAWLDGAYTYLSNLDKEWSAKRGWPESIRLTTCKPSGTLSLLGGSTPGVHPGFSRFYIRRVRMSSDDMLVGQCRDLGYHIETARRFDGTEDPTTMVVSFPCRFSDETIITSEMSAVRQLELVKRLQTVWSDNSVSVTVYYHLHELDAIKAWLKENYASSLKSVSFLLHSGHGFDQAPYEEISEDRYNAEIASVKSLSELSGFNSSDLLDGIECSGGVCPVR